MSSMLVQSKPSSYYFTYKHMLWNTYLYSQERKLRHKMQQIIEQEAQRYGGQLPPELQQQFQQQLEIQVADKISDYNQ